MITKPLLRVLAMAVSVAIAGLGTLPSAFADERTTLSSDDYAILTRVFGHEPSETERIAYIESFRRVPTEAEIAAYIESQRAESSALGEVPGVMPMVV